MGTVKFHRAAVAAFGLILASTTSYAQSDPNEAARRRAFDERDISKIVATYKENQIRFNHEYRGKVFMATLPFFDEMENTFNTGSYTVGFGEGTVSGDIECDIANIDDIRRMANWVKGQKIVVKGIIDKISLGSIKLISCTAIALQ